MSDLLPGKCAHCAGEFEFDAGDAGAVAPCPHCGRETMLEIAGEETALAAEAASSPRKSRRWIAVAGIAVAVLAVAGSAAAFYLKRNHGHGGDSAGGNGGSKSGGSSSGTTLATARTAADMAAETPKDVIPVIASYQGGLTADQIRRGRDVFWDKCTECHRLFDPSVYAADHWDKTIASMRGKAKLNGAQAEELNIFIRSLRER